ncbi:MAG: quinone-dependent dihydroorotate dehydrogenase [Meiothermus sp.]|nr:quinone-dependent dihydroorotate dehydrogenase [Meiothermus sp.]
MYSLLKPYLFSQDPETVHDSVMAGLAFLSRRGPSLGLLSRLCRVEDKRLEVSAFGLKFPNPVGLAAGFDKNAVALRSWAAMGFGSVEIGSVTALAQPGNDRPRLFRLPDDDALINRMGFNNQGAEAVAGRLEESQKRFGRLPVPLGINLGKSKVVALQDAPRDYLESLERLWDLGDYFVVNVSSPNTPGLRELQDRDRLEELLAAVTEFANGRKPIVLKIAPDLTWGQLDQIIGLVEIYKLAGLIATNTTVAREGLKTPIHEVGGLSGKPLRERSLEVLKYLKAHSRVPVVSVGGISSVDDVWTRLEAGAVMVQLYTALVYEGPFLIRDLNRGLLRRLEREGGGSVGYLSGQSVKLYSNS